VRLGIQSSGATSPLEQADNEGGTDAEDPADLSDGALVVIDRCRNPLPQIQGIGVHGITSVLPRLLILKCP
jgi:hypothetical protein